MSDFDNDEYIKETVKRAKEGDSDAAKECLDSVVTAIYNYDFNSPYLFYLADRLEYYLNSEASIKSSLGLKESKKNGRPKKYDEVEISSIDLLLREHAGFKIEETNVWIEEAKGIDRRSIQTIRKNYFSRYNETTHPDLSESRRRDYLLHDLSQEMREKLVGVLPHIKE